MPVIQEQSQDISPYGVTRAHKALQFLNEFLKNNEWVAGDRLTVADFSIAATASALNLLVPIDVDTYPNVVKWLTNMEKVPSYDAGRPGLEIAKAFFDELLSH